jgi:methionyl-tRNA formyltransferase
MSTIRIVISAPIDSNLYSLLVSKHCINEVNVDVVGILTLKTLSLKRISTEYKRLGKTLLRKIWKKYCSITSHLIFEKNDCTSDVLIADAGLQYNSLKQLASSYDISYLKVDNPNDKHSIKFLNNLKPDIIISIGSCIIREAFLQIPKIGVFNVHMGILPEYRGIGVTEWPIIENNLETIGLGVTLHLMEAGVDTGPIIMKKNINLNKKDTLDSLESKYLKEMVQLMILGVRMAKEHKLCSIPQKISDGKQYFETHKRMKVFAEKKIKTICLD